jgi:hypothetical protein
MIQLNPTIPIVRVSDSMKGYAFLVIDYSQEHDLLFTCAMDNGEIWTLSNKDIKIQNNISLNRKTDDYINPPLHTTSEDSLFAPNGTLHSGTRPNDLRNYFTSLTTEQQNAIIEASKDLIYRPMKY